jgi:hypothetical protein
MARQAYATMRPDECFNGAAEDECTIYNDKSVASTGIIETGTCCAKPKSGLSTSFGVVVP